MAKYNAGNGAIFIQPGGPNTAPKYLGCHGLGDLTAPKGDLSLQQCPDPEQPGEMVTYSETQAAPGVVTTSIEGLLQKAADYLEGIRCPVPIYVNMVSCGKKNVFAAYGRGFALARGYITEESLKNLASRTAKDESTIGFAISGPPPLLKYYRLKGARQSTSEPRGLNDVQFCNNLRCDGACGYSKPLGTDGFAVGKALVGSALGTANVDITEDGGGDGWPAGAADPFGTGEDIASETCFYISGEVVRKLVVRGSTDAGNPMEIAYSDDEAATWNRVNVGSTNGEYAVDSQSLFSLDMEHIWVVSNLGRIYFSADGGASWDCQENAVITAGAYHCIFFQDELIGYAGAAGDIIVRTADGGTTWSAVTATGSGDVINCIGHNPGTALWWAGTSGGEMYFSSDDGATWAARAFTGSGAGTVDDVQFLNALQGAMLHNTAGPVGTLFVTQNGGYTWEAVPTTMTTNAGLNALWFVKEDLIFAVGNVSGGTAVIIKYQPAP